MAAAAGLSVTLADLSEQVLETALGRIDAILRTDLMRGNVEAP